MINESYMKTLNWLAENNITLSKTELNDLKNKIESAEYNDTTQLSYAEAFDILSDIDYELEEYSENSGSILFESANSDLSARFKQLKKEFKDLNKQYKQNIKINQYVAASNNLDQMSKVLASAEKDIRSIDASSLGSKAGGFFRTFGLQIIAIALAGFLATKKVSRTIGNKAKSNLGKAAIVSGLNALEKSTNTLVKTGNASKANRVGERYLKTSTNLYKAANNANRVTSATTKGLLAFTISQSLLDVIEIFRQSSKDKKSGNEADVKNAGNFYREKLLILIKEMRKEIGRKQKTINKLSKKKDNEMIDDENNDIDF